MAELKLVSFCGHQVGDGDGRRDCLPQLHGALAYYQNPSCLWGEAARVTTCAG